METEPNRMDDAAGAIVLAFDTDAADFARGFEAGALWSDLSASSDQLEALIHTASVEMVMRMGEALGRVVVGDVIDETWTRVLFAAVAEPQ